MSRHHAPSWWIGYRAAAFMLGLLSLFIAPDRGLAQTSYTDAFDGPALNARWSSSAQYAVSWDSGTMRVAMNKNDKWQGLYHDLGGTYDFSARPVVNLKVRGEVPFLLHVYFVDKNNKNILVGNRVHEVGRLHNFCYDMATATQPSGFDMTAIKAMIFTPNGNGKALSGTAWLDDLRVGTAATRFANARAVPDQHRYKNATNCAVLVTDITNASALTVSASTLLTNVVVAPVVAGQALLTYDCRPGVTGDETLTLTALGVGGFANQTQTFAVVVYDNAAPTLDAIADPSIEVGVPRTIRLTGVSDGDATAEQTISFTVTSSDPAAMPHDALSVTHAAGSPYADLRLTAASAATGIVVTVTVDDGQAVNSTTSVVFRVNAYANYNHAPTLEALADRTAKLSGGAHTFDLTGIGDGDNGAQTLTFSVTSSNHAVVSPGSMVVEYGGGSTGRVQFTPLAEGATTLTVTLADDGSGGDNGPSQVTRSFDLQVLPDLPTGFTEDFADLNGWGFSGTYTPSLSTFGGSNCIKVTGNNKWYWDGYQLSFEPDLDLAGHPYVSMEVYSEGKDTLHWLWFYDDAGVRNINVGAMDKAQWAPTGQWTRLVFDFSGNGAMSDSSGEPINAERITYILFNMHDRVSSWPLPANYSGAFYIRNVRVGSAADLGLPHCTVDGIPDQVHFAGTPPQQLRLSGLSGGIGGGTATVTAVSSNTNLVPHPVLSPVAPDGTAFLTYAPAAGVGRATLTVTVHAAGSVDAQMPFNVDLLSTNPALFQAVQVNVGQEYQTIRGFGAYQFPNQPHYVADYTGDLGASAVRLGFIGNQLEPDNDNNDPNVLNRAALNYDALDFEYLRRLKAGGVETFILTSWSPPAWMKDNLSEDYAQASARSWSNTDNRLSLGAYEEFAESMVAAVRVIKEEADIDLYAIGLQNEPAFCEPYGSAILDPARFVELVKVVGARFAREGIATRLFMPEQVFSQSFYSMKQYIDALQADPVADGLCDVIATHGYADDGVQPGQPDFSQWGAMWTNASAPPHPKELWMTETYPEGGTWTQALSLAGAMHGALTAGNVSLWTLWSIEGTLMDGSRRTPSFHAARHYYSFIRPGWKRTACAATNADLLVSASCGGDETAVVMINKGSNALAVQVAGPVIPSTFEARLSSNNRDFELLPAVTNGVLLLPPHGIATLHGDLGYERWASGIDWKGKDPMRDADPDGDGMDNDQEFVAGSDPTNPASAFSLAALDVPDTAAGGLVLRWPSISNRLYSIARSAHVAGPFSEVATDLPATPQENVYTDHVHAADEIGFYTIGVKRPHN
jgi:O-glycosyl hydrolase